MLAVPPYGVLFRKILNGQLFVQNKLMHMIYMLKAREGIAKLMLHIEQTGNNHSTKVQKTPKGC